MPDHVCCLKHWRILATQKAGFNFPISSTEEKDGDQAGRDQEGHELTRLAGVGAPFARGVAPESGDGDWASRLPSGWTAPPFDA